MERLLVIVDMQNDFIDGSLANKDAKAIIPAAKNARAEFHSWKINATNTGTNVTIPISINIKPKAFAT